jgi:hypothetical protein
VSSKSNRGMKVKVVKFLSMQVFIVKSMNLFRQIRPRQRPRKFLLDFSFIPVRTFLRQLDLPSTKVIKQPHVGLDEHR